MSRPREDYEDDPRRPEWSGKGGSDDETAPLALGGGDEEGRRRRLLFTVLGIVALVAIAWLAVTMLTGGEQQGEPLPEPEIPSAAPEEGAEKPSQPQEQAPASTQQPSSLGLKDPFEPEVETSPSPEPPQQTAGAPPSAGGETPPSPGGQAPPPAVAPPPGTVPQPSPPTPILQNKAILRGKEVKLRAVFTGGPEPLARVRVGKDTYLVAEGEKLATEFRITRIKGGCATLGFGKKKNRVTLCTAHLLPPK